MGYRFSKQEELVAHSLCYYLGSTDEGVIEENGSKKTIHTPGFSTRRIAHTAFSRWGNVGFSVSVSYPKNAKNPSYVLKLKVLDEIPERIGYIDRPDEKRTGIFYQGTNWQKKFFFGVLLPAIRGLHKKKNLENLADSE